MKVDVTKLILDMDDQEIEQDGTKFTIGMAIRMAALHEYKDKPADGQEKFARYLLAQKCKRAETDQKPLVMTVEEAALVKELAGLRFVPLVVGRLFEALEGGAA